MNFVLFPILFYIGGSNILKPLLYFILKKKKKKRKPHFSLQISGLTLCFFNPACLWYATITVDLCDIYSFQD